MSELQTITAMQHELGRQRAALRHAGLTQQGLAAQAGFSCSALVTGCPVVAVIGAAPARVRAGSWPG